MFDPAVAEGSGLSARQRHPAPRPEAVEPADQRQGPAEAGRLRTGETHWLPHGDVHAEGGDSVVQES